MKTCLYGLCILLASCSVNKEDKYPKWKKVEYKDFAIRIPAAWITFNANGIDSRIEGIVSDMNDTIYVQTGSDIIKFNEVIPVNPIEQRAKLDSMGWSDKSLSEMKFSETPQLDGFQGVFLREYYFYDSLDGRRAKFILPKRMGEGFIGLQIDSIRPNFGLSIYAQDMDTLQHYALYKAFQTIKFK